MTDGDVQQRFEACLREAKKVVAAYRAEAPAGFDPKNIDLPPGYDPIQADFHGGGYISPGDQAIGGLIGLSAFAMIGVGAFFTFAAAAATEEALGVTFVLAPDSGIGGLAAFCEGTVELTEARVIILAEIEAAAINTEMGGGPLAALTACASSWGLQSFGVEAIIALAMYNPREDAQNYGMLGEYLGNFVFQYGLPGGGLTTPPGFPGFPGGGYNNPYGTGGMVCYVVNDTEMCHWEE